MKTYRFADGEFEIRNEIKRSVFIATVKGEVDAQGAEDFVKAVKKKYPDATHNCYAYISDELGNATRFSDDGEPGGTAGQPILDVIKKQGLVRTAIVVTRYFGGIKLGAGGLVGAYSSAAADALSAAKISEKKECGTVCITADYPTFSLIDKFLRKQNVRIIDTVYGNEVKTKIYVTADDIDGFLDSVSEISAGRAQVQVSDERVFVAI